MKRLFAILLLTIMTLSTWAYDACVDGIYYNLNSTNQTASVTNTGTYIGGYSGSIVIPSSILYNDITYSVTSVADWAFEYSTGLTSITIPSSITYIGSSAFFCNTKLAAISVDANNTIYDSRNNCNAIIKTSTNTLISGCKTTTIPNSVTSIGSYAFYYCTDLTSITIPNSVTSIDYSAFSGCTRLTSITIPNSVTSIGNRAFSGCI